MDGRDLAPDPSQEAYPWQNDAAERVVLPGGEQQEPPKLPLRAAWLAVFALFLGAAVSILTGGVAYALWSEADAPSIIGSAIGLYGVLAFTVVRASRRWGTGRLGPDLGLHFRRIDIAWGPLSWLLAFAAVVAVGLALSPFPELEGSNTDILADDPSASTIAAMVIVAVAAAPVFEELLFRGLLLRALLSGMAPVPAIGLQALAFGMVHLQPDEGLGNIGLVVSLGAVGAAFGVAAYRARRLGPAIVGHAIFNAVATVATLVLD